MTLSFRKLNSMVQRALTFFFMLIATIQPVLGTEFTEDQIKAVYLFNFAEFIRWPDSAFSEHPGAFHFCALNEKSPIIHILKKIIQGETAKGRELIFHKINNQDDLRGCQLWYVQANEQAKFTTFLPKLKARNILTVSDIEGFAEHSGMIGITRLNKNLHLFINTLHLNQAGLKASAKLLRLASIVDGEE
jgi:hypothetical protein